MRPLPIRLRNWRSMTLRKRRFAFQTFLAATATLFGVYMYRKWWLELEESCNEFYPDKNERDDDVEKFFRLNKTQGFQSKFSVSFSPNVTVNKSGDFSDKYLKFYNRLGGAWSGMTTLIKAVQEVENEDLKLDLWNRTRKARHNYLSSQDYAKYDQNITKSTQSRIVVATVACGKSAMDAMVMLKSAVIFSLDSNFHIIIFSDSATLPILAQAVLELKWSINSMGWDFTYEFHKDWFPEDDDTDWKNVYSLCSSQRLFFPSLLHDVDSLIYLDADTIILSNLTEIWDKFKWMNDEQIVAMAPNNIYPANGIYNLFSKIPFYQPRGLNSGVILMNLTRMRDFKLQKKTTAAFNMYKEKIAMPDQDVYNIIFNAYPEKLMLLSCTLNFMYVFCGEAKKLDGGSSDELLYVCVYENIPGPKCFCEDAVHSGVGIVHGVSQTFHVSNHPFLLSLYENMRKFRIVQEGSFGKLMKDLYQEFSDFEDQCFHLTADMLYGNAKSYLRAHKLL